VGTIKTIGFDAHGHITASMKTITQVDNLSDALALAGHYSLAKEAKAISF
jgi:hypothetical protein